MIIHKGVENKKFIRFNNDNHLYRTADLQAIDCSLLSNKYPFKVFSPGSKVCSICINISQLITVEIPQTKFFLLPKTLFVKYTLNYQNKHSYFAAQLLYYVYYV